MRYFETPKYICSVITEDHLEFRRQVNIEVTMEAYIHELINIPSLYKERLRLYYHSELGVIGDVDYKVDDNEWNSRGMIR